MVYIPDNWVVIKYKGDDPHHRIFAGWSGGYATGDSWRMNSGIVRVEEDEHLFLFYGASGSCYECNKQSYCLRNNNAHIWIALKEGIGADVELMPEDTDWLSMDWIIK